MYTIDEKLGFCVTTLRAVMADLKCTPDSIGTQNVIHLCRQMNEEFEKTGNLNLDIWKLIRNELARTKTE
jgi:hypothetical protein